MLHVGAIGTRKSPAKAKSEGYDFLLEHKLYLSSSVSYKITLLSGEDSESYSYSITKMIWYYFYVMILLLQ